MTIWEFSQLTSGESAFVSRVLHIAPALFSVPLVTNLVITALLVWRIWQAQRATKITSNHRMYAFYRSVIMHTIESCIIYPFVLMVTLILYCTNNNGQDIVSLIPDDLPLALSLKLIDPVRVVVNRLNDPSRSHRSNTDVAPAPLRSQFARE